MPVADPPSGEVPILEPLLDHGEGGLLGEPLSHYYGGQLDLPDQCLYSNFVASVDGAVALPEVPNSNRLISGGSAADRFLMGLLRALADVVLIGTGTLQASPRSLWNADAAFPPASRSYAELRASMGLPEHPHVAIIAGRNMPAPEHPVLLDGATVLAPAARARDFQTALPATTTVVGIESQGDRVDVTAVVGHLKSAGHRRILSEAGPHLFGRMLDQGLVDEIFLTVAPQVAGGAPDKRYSLVEGVSFLPESPRPLALDSVRRWKSELFLRYRTVR